MGVYVVFDGYVDVRDEVDARLVDDVLEGALGALGDEH